MEVFYSIDGNENLQYWWKWKLALLKIQDLTRKHSSRMRTDRTVIRMSSDRVAMRLIGNIMTDTGLWKPYLPSLSVITDSHSILSEANFFHCCYIKIFCRVVKLQDIFEKGNQSIAHYLLVQAETWKIVHDHGSYESSVMFHFQYPSFSWNLRSRLGFLSKIKGLLKIRVNFLTFWLIKNWKSMAAIDHNY